MSSISRRAMLGGAAAAAAGIVAGGASIASADCPKCAKPVPKLCNDMFYKDGVFQPDVALKAYYDMFERFGWPNPKPHQDIIWTLDFGMGDFIHAGMAGVFWWNSEEYSYFGHTIYLLPGQMIPEHRHMPTAKGPAKMEAWHVVFGSVLTFGEGPEMPEMVAKVPESQRASLTVKNAQPLLPGEVRELNRREAYHFMMAGDEGAIVMEYATFHDMDGLEFANPKAKL